MARDTQQDGYQVGGATIGINVLYFANPPQVAINSQLATTDFVNIALSPPKSIVTDKTPQVIHPIKYYHDSCYP